MRGITARSGFLWCLIRLETRVEEFLEWVCCSKLDDDLKPPQFLTVWSFLWLFLCIVYSLNINKELRIKDRIRRWSGDIYWLQINEDTLRVLSDEISSHRSYWFYSNHAAMMWTQVRNGVTIKKNKGWKHERFLLNAFTLYERVFFWDRLILSPRLKAMPCGGETHKY